MVGIPFPSLSFALGDNFGPKNVFNFELFKIKSPAFEVYISTFGLAHIYQ
jgi:hypothetical protein